MELTATLRQSAAAVVASGLVAWALVVPATAQAATTTTPFGGTTGVGPRAITVDANGNIYTGNVIDDTVTRISADGLTTTQNWATTGDEPMWLTFHDGDLYVADTGADTVSRIPPTGGAGQPFGSATGDMPVGIVFDDDGNLYTANQNDDSVTKIEPDGTTTQPFASLNPAGCDQPTGIAIDSAGFLYVAAISNKVCRIYSSTGVVADAFDLPVNSAPEGIAVDAAGNLYTANSGTATVSRITPAGDVSQFGSTTGDAPLDVVVDPDGNVFTANIGSDSVTRISADAATTDQTWAATGPSPFGLTVDADGIVYTANSGDDTVTRISPDDRGPLTFSSGAFGATTVGGTAPLTVTVTNTGSGSVRPSAIDVAGTGVSTSGGTCAVGSLIAPAGTCTVALSWDPTAAGALTGGSLALNFRGGASSSNELALTGTATLATQTITFPAMADAAITAAAPTPAATASSGLPVSYTSATTGTCTVTTGGAITLLTTGACTITASQAGDATFAAATPTSQSFTITPAVDPTPSPTPTPTPTPSPTPTPTPSPTDRTRLVVTSARGGSVPADDRTALVRTVRTNGTITKVAASCELRGNRLRGAVAARLCDLTVIRASGNAVARDRNTAESVVVTAKRARVRVTAEPTCSAGLRLRAVVRAKKPGAAAKTWTETWRVAASPAIPCRVRGTG